MSSESPSVFSVDPPHFRELPPAKNTYALESNCRGSLGSPSQSVMTSNASTRVPSTTDSKPTVSSLPEITTSGWIPSNSATTHHGTDSLAGSLAPASTRSKSTDSPSAARELLPSNSTGRVPADWERSEWWNASISCQVSSANASSLNLTGEGRGWLLHQCQPVLEVKWEISLSAIDLECLKESKKNTIERLPKEGMMSYRDRALKTQFTRNCPRELVANGQIEIGTDTADLAMVLQKGCPPLGIVRIVGTLPFNDSIMQNSQFDEILSAITSCMARKATEACKSFYSDHADNSQCLELK
ncbi:hypothetical protein NliqN6_5770 [Naganishia liquefaciens]|uniref:Uncharacterized protein n=1 Tax=Naganishia liquefaciens TaxID=104408 RepID=A0A8H3TYG0_9TREE|nr:hypothetical protein NliqN6_5770 [Naganishia liquefaciens]